MTPYRQRPVLLEIRLLPADLCGEVKGASIRPPPIQSLLVGVFKGVKEGWLPENGAQSRWLTFCSRETQQARILPHDYACAEALSVRISHTPLYIIAAASAAAP